MSENWRTELSHYTIDADHVVHGPVSFDEWLEWAAPLEAVTAFDRLCRVARTQIDGDCFVSTVFLRGINLNVRQYDPSEPPLLFETLVFGGEHGRDCDRYSTWSEAAAGHAAMVAQVMHGEETSP